MVRSGRDIGMPLVHRTTISEYADVLQHLGMPVSAKK